MSKTWVGLCPGCFQEKGGAALCPHCNYDESARRGPLVLPHRTLLQGQYLIGAVLGKPGGFGITYLALDVRLETLVAVKEYLPRDLAGREAGTISVSAHSQDDGRLFRFGLEQFLAEARTLAKFDHAHVVRVRSVFEENGTAYLVMDYYEGISLAEYLEKKGRLSEATAVDIIMPILDGLREVHGKGFLHRDIKPQNIYLTTDGRPILLDFGSARVAMGEHSNTLSVVLTPGYAPFEQYHRKGDQGPWTDIYSCSAVLYQMLTGETPPEAPERAERDSLVPPKTLVPALSPSLNQAVLAGLAVKPSARPQSVQAFQSKLRPRQTLEPKPPPAPDIYAGFWKRVAASLIDSIVSLVFAGIVGFLVGGGAGLAGLGGAEKSLELLGNALGLLLYWIYYAGLESSPHQATVGKLVLGIKVTDLEGRRISFWRATGRQFGKYLSALILGIGFAMAGFTQRKQALHDKLANCLVVDKSVQAASPGQADNSSTQAVFATVGGLFVLLLVMFGILAKNEISQKAREQSHAQTVQELQGKLAQAEDARREEQLRQRREAREREYARGLEAKRAEEESRRQAAEAEAKREPVRAVVTYYNLLGKDSQAALAMWTNPGGRTKLAKLIANTQYAEVQSAMIGDYGEQFSTVWVDVWVKARDQSQARHYKGYAEVQWEPYSGRWLISSLKGILEQ